MSDVMAIRLEPTQIVTRDNQGQLITYSLPPEWDHDDIVQALSQLTARATFLVLISTDEDGEILLDKPSGNDPIISGHILLSQLGKAGLVVSRARALQERFYHSRCREAPTPNDRTGVMVLQDDPAGGGTVNFYVVSGSAAPVGVTHDGQTGHVHYIQYAKPLSRMPWKGSEYALAFARSFPDLAEILLWSAGGLEIANGWGGADSCFRQDIRDALGDYCWERFVLMDLDADLNGACLVGGAAR